VKLFKFHRSGAEEWIADIAMNAVRQPCTPSLLKTSLADYVAPTELEIFLGMVFYKYVAPTALGVALNDEK